MRLNKNVLICSAIALMTVAAYEPIRHNGFVNYDDPGYVTENPDITSGITKDSIIRAFTKPQDYVYMWHPLTTLSHIIDCQLFGLNPTGHHIVSLAIHIINALLVFRILKSFTGATWVSAFIAMVFALHPLQVESVAWVSERKTVLSGLFWLLTMAAYIHYVRKPTIRRYLLLFIVFGLCILTKPVVVTEPLALILLDYWPLERLKDKKTFGGLIIEKIPLLLLLLFLSIMTYKAQQGGGTVISLGAIPFGVRLSNAFVSYFRYIGKMIWPGNLSVFYPPLDPSFSKITLAVCIILFFLITVLSIYYGRRRKYLATGWLWFAGTLVPMIGVVQSGYQAMANRYMYLSMLGLLIIIGFGIKEVIEKLPRLRAFASAGTIILLATMMVLTRMQVKHWQNSLTLFEYALKSTGDNAAIETNYGCALFYDAGNAEAAEEHLSKAIALSPTYAKARNNLGKIYLMQGKTNEAIECFEELIRQKQDSAEVHFNLALGLGAQKKYSETIKELTRVLEMSPGYPDAANRMGIALTATGKAEEAIKYFEKALRINKDKSEIYGNLGTAYMRIGDFKHGIYNFNKAVEQNPDSIVNLNCLAWALVTVEDASVRDVNRAIESARRACELTGNNNAEYLDTLSVTYAAAGRFEEARATATKALDIATAAGKNDLASEIKEHIKLYEAGQPYPQK